MSVYWTEDRKQRVVDYMSGLIFGYCIGMIVGVWILWNVVYVNGNWTLNILDTETPTVGHTVNSVIKSLEDKYESSSRQCRDIRYNSRFIW